PLYNTVVSSSPAAAGPTGRLYAMGVDAQRIFNRLLQMQEHPETRIHGATGTLSLDPSGRVRRELSWGQIVDGQLQPVGDLAPWVAVAGPCATSAATRPSGTPHSCCSPPERACWAAATVANRVSLIWSCVMPLQ